MAPTIICVGINHRTAPLAVREKLALNRTDLPGAVEVLRRLPGVAEAALVSTCNRVEAYLVAVSPVRASRSVREYFRKKGRIAVGSLSRVVYQHERLDAVGHLISVASGLDSQVVGESQILSQVKEAYAVALAAGATGAILNGLFNRALAAAKKVRTDTEIGRLPTSISSVAVTVAGRIFGDLKKRTILLLGTGETSVLVAENLIAAGAPRLLVAAERNHDRAVELATRYGGEALRLSEARARLNEVDIVIAATAATDHILRAEDVRRALHDKRSGPIFLLDLGVPRNIDPAISNLSNAYLYNLDDLKNLATDNMKRREEWIAPAREIIAGEIEGIRVWLDSITVVPTIVALNEYGERCRREVMDRAGPAIRDLDPRVREEIDYLTKALVTKILHRPISSLKETTPRDCTTACADLLRRLFKLE